MLFIVADDADETLETPVADISADDATENARKAQLDDAETTRSTQKVDLDLDDAPFLEDEEEEEELLPEEEFQLPTEAAEPSEKKGIGDLLKNKFVLGGLVLFVVLVIGAYFLLGRDTPEAPPPPVEEVEIVVEEPQPQEMAEEVPVEEPGEMLVKLDPFIIEMRDSEAALRFVEISLVFSTPDPMLANNLTRETPTVRYALFYYLRSKDLAFLTDQTNMDSLKQELLSVANQYMVNGQFETLLFEQFLVK